MKLGLSIIIKRALLWYLSHARNKPTPMLTQPNKGTPV